MQIVKNILCSMLTTCAVLAFTGVAAAESNPITLKIDSNRSQISFISEAPAEKIVGTASKLQGTIKWDLSKLEAIQGTISFPVESMQTGNNLRDRHLRGKDWLNASANPTVEFHIQSLENVRRTEKGEQIVIEAVAVGEVMVNGVKAPNRAQVEVAILPERKLVRIQPKIQLKLADHKVAGKRGTIGDKVGEVIDIEGLVYGSWK